MWRIGSSASVLLWLLLLSAPALAITVVTPTVDPTTVNPGSSFTVSCNVSEDAGASNIYETNMSCVGSGGTEWTDSWDSYKLLNSSFVWTTLDLLTIQANGTFTLNTSSINGTWTCTCYGYNSTDSASAAVSQPTVNTRVGITLDSSACVFAAGNPGDANKDWTCGGNSYDRFTHDGNINTNVTISGTPLTGLTDISWAIAASRVTYTNVTAGGAAPSAPGTTLTTVASLLSGQWSRGAYPTKSALDLYSWLSYPNPLKAQTYEGTISLLAAGS